jgi:hypothetical protein
VPGSGVILEFHAGRDFGSEFFKFPANAAMPGVNSRFGSSALRANSRNASPVGAGNPLRLRREFFRVGRELIRRGWECPSVWFHGIDLLEECRSRSANDERNGRGYERQQMEKADDKPQR